jgi:imidazolonepropionase-like amidohydrolase
MVESGAAPQYAMKKLESMADLHADAMARSHAAGVRHVAGTDQATSNRGGTLGRHGREQPLLEEIGMTPLEAIEAATAAAPETLGPQAPRSGRLAEGYDADVIMVDGDPLVDLKLLADPTRILGVWRGGRRVKH